MHANPESNKKQKEQATQLQKAKLFLCNDLLTLLHDLKYASKFLLVALQPNGNDSTVQSCLAIDENSENEVFCALFEQTDFYRRTYTILQQ